MKEITEEEIWILIEMWGILYPSNSVNAIYRDPVASLRYQADELENEQRIKKEFNKLIERIKF